MPRVKFPGLDLFVDSGVASPSTDIQSHPEILLWICWCLVAFLLVLSLFRESAGTVLLLFWPRLYKSKWFYHCLYHSSLFFRWQFWGSHGRPFHIKIYGSLDVGLAGASVDTMVANPLLGLVYDSSSQPVVWSTPVVWVFHGFPTFPKHKATNQQGTQQWVVLAIYIPFCHLTNWHLSPVSASEIAAGDQCSKLAASPNVVLLDLNFLLVGEERGSEWKWIVVISNNP